MAVIGAAQEMMEGCETLRGENSHRAYKKQYRVLTDSRYDDDKVVLAAPLLPGMYEAYTSTLNGNDNSALVVRQTPRRHPKSATTWFVTVDWDTKYERIDNPFTEPPEIEYGDEPFKEPVPGTAKTDYDPSRASPDSASLNGAVPPVTDANDVAWSRPIVNSAGAPYIPPPERDASRDLITFTRNQSTFSAVFKRKFINTVNKTPWCGLEARQARIKGIHAQSLVFKSSDRSAPDIFYYRVSYTFSIKPETWDLFVLDYGPYYLKWTGSGLVVPGATGERKSFNVEGSGGERLGLLDHSDINKPGQKLADGSAPQFLRFPAYREIDFGELSIDLNTPIASTRYRQRQYNP